MADNATQIVISAKDDTRAAFESVKGALGGIEAAASRLPAVGAALAGALSLGAFTSGIQSAIKFAASLDDMAERTGASVESLSALGKVAKIGGHDLQVVETAAIRLSKAMAGADDEAKGAGHAFEYLGLKADDLGKLQTGEALKKVADAFAKLQDGPGKVALAMDLFGRSGAQLLPFLKDLAETGELNGKVTAEQAAQAEAYEKSMKRLESSLGQTAKTVAMALLPALADTAAAMEKIVKPGGGNQEVHFDWLDRALNWAAQKLAAAEAGFAGFRVRALKALGATDLAGRAELEGAQASANLARLQGEISTLDQKDRYGELYSKAALGYKTGVARIDASGYKSRLGKEDKAGKEPKAPGSVQDYETRIGEMVGSAINNADIIKAAEYAAVQARLLDMLNKGQISEELYASALMKTSHAQGLVSDEAEHFNKLLAATPTAKIEEARKDMQMLAAALEAGSISEAQFIEAAQTRIGQLGDGIKEVDNFARDMGLTFSSAFEDAIVGGKSLSDVLKGLAQDIARIVIRKTITEPAGNAIASIIKEGLGDLFGGGKAGGGPLEPGKWYVAGERGPEPIWGGGPGAFAAGYGRMAELGGAGGAAVSIVQHINVDARADQASIRAAMHQSKEAAKAEIMADMSRGGGFAKAVGRA